MTAEAVSGFRWLETLPTRWNRAALKHLVSGMRSGDAIAAEAIEAVGLPFPVYGANGLRGFAANFTHDGPHVLVGRQGALCGNVHLVDGRFWASEHAIVVTPAPTVDSRWLAQVMTAMDLGQYSTNAAQPGIGVAQISGLAVPVPPLSEQRLIADYLDHEIARIDELLAKQRALIETSRERHVAIRDSHFERRHAQRSTTVRRVLAPMHRAPVQGLGVVTAYRDGVVTLRSNRRDGGYTFSDSEHGYQEVRTGDLVFHALDGFAGAVGISDSHGVCTPVYHVCQVISDDVPEYVAMLLRHLGTSGFLATQAPNVRERSVDFRNWQTFARIPLDLPSPDEQRAVVADIVKRTVEIETLITKAEQFVELAKERRAALITAAVTGQIYVQAAT